MLLEKRKHTLEIGERSTDNSHSVLKRNAAARQREEWYSHIFQAKAVKVCDVPQEKRS
jgi:hypothetical protein